MRRGILAVLFTLVFTGCERTTAPRALQLVDETEAKLWQNWTPPNIPGVGEGNFDKLWLSFADRSMILAQNNGARDRLNAAVIERVVIPPSGSGEPLSRRSLVAWSPNVRYAVMAVTQTGTDENSSLTDVVDEDALHPRPVLVAPGAHYQDWWVPGSGSVVIEPETNAGNCPFVHAADESRWGRTDDLTCSVVTYTVRAEGELVRREERQNMLLPDAMKQHHHIVLAAQQVKGIRFTMRCPTNHRPERVYPSNWYAAACEGFPYAFWRSNRLFAPILGVDVSHMEPVKLQDPVIYIRTLRAGVQETRSEPPRIRWTLSYPDGTIADRDSTVDDSGRVWLGQCAFFGSSSEIGYGGRRQCLVPQMGDPKMRSRFGVFVLDMESSAQ